MKNKISLLGMLALVLIFGLVFSGCTSMFDAIQGQQKVETETSKRLLKGANDLILARADGINFDALKVSLAQKYPGLKFTSPTPSLGGLGGSTTADFTYQNKKYRMGFTGSGKDQSSGSWTHITSATSCVELQQKAAE